MKKRYGIILVLLLCTALYSQQNIESLIDSAKTFYENKQYKEATNLLDKVISLSPRNIRALSFQGLSHYNLVDYKNAKKYFSLAAMYSDPDDKNNLANHYSNLSACYYQLEDNEKAYEFALKAYYLYPNSVQNLWNAVSLANNHNSYEKAMDLLRESYNLTYHNDFNALYGRTYLGLKQYDESAASYNRFFNEYDENNVYTESINLLDEKLNFTFSCLYLLNQNIEFETEQEYNKEPYLYEERLLQLVIELSGTPKEPKVLEALFYVLKNTENISHNYMPIFTKVFERCIQTTQLQQIKFYFLAHDYKKCKSQALALQDNKPEKWLTEEEKIELKMYLYLSELKLIKESLYYHPNEIEDDDFQSIINLFSDFYHFVPNDYDKIIQTEIYFTPFRETIKAFSEVGELQTDFIRKILSSLFETIPNSKLKEELLSYVDNTIK